MYYLLDFVLLECRVEYSTWAGMIVTQYGRLPGGEAGAALSGGPARQSTAVDQLQRYYGTGDTASEPGDFKPGASLPSCSSVTAMATPPPSPGDPNGVRSRTASVFSEQRQAEHV